MAGIKINPKELELRKKNDVNKVRFFLDLCTALKNNRFSISLYDKPYDFSFFHCLNYFICCNISSKMFSAAFGAENLRIARAASLSNNVKTWKLSLIELRSRVEIFWFKQKHILNMMAVVFRCFKSSLIYPLHSKILIFIKL